MSSVVEGNIRRYHLRRNRFIKLLGGKCVRCGSIDSLEFDHIDASKKAFNIAKKINYPDYKILPELEKCQLLCKDCHKEKSRKEGQRREPWNKGMRTKPHGTATSYSYYKCRCELCREAKRLSRKTKGDYNNGKKFSD